MEKKTVLSLVVRVVHHLREVDRVTDHPLARGVGVFGGLIVIGIVRGRCQRRRIVEAPSHREGPRGLARAVEGALSVMCVESWVGESRRH